MPTSGRSNRQGGVRETRGGGLQAEAAFILPEPDESEPPLSESFFVLLLLLLFELPSELLLEVPWEVPWEVLWDEEDLALSEYPESNQPPPLSWNEVLEISFSSFPAHSGHLRFGRSVIFCMTSIS